MDPLAELYYSISPYAYCANNPLKYIDLDGEHPDLPLIYEAIVYIGGTLGVGYLLYEYRDEITFTTSKPGVTELNKGHIPDPGWTRREKNSANYTISI